MKGTEIYRDPYRKEYSSELRSFLKRQRNKKVRRLYKGMILTKDG